MSRTAHVVTGSVLAAVLLLVALGAGVLSAAAGGGGAFGPGGFFAPEDLSGSAEGEVLDVDDDLGWPLVDVRFTTEDGEVVVTSVDWEWGPLPDVGDVVGIAYDPADPEWAYAADDPYVRVVAVEADEDAAAEGDEAAAAEDDEAGAGADEELARVAGWVSLAALVGIAVVAVATAVAAARAPAPVRAGSSGQPWAGQPYAGQPFAGQPFAGQPYAGQPYAGQPYVGQQYAGPAAAPVDSGPRDQRPDWSSPR